MREQASSLLQKRCFDQSITPDLLAKLVRAVEIKASPLERPGFA
jgi:hypothetical protein